jgi:H+/Cl- antiporter ClcA
VTGSPRRHPWAERGLVVAGAIAALVAVFHAVAIVRPEVSEPSPAWRHALFVVVNLVAGALFVARVRWLPVPFALLAAQQVWSHGSSFLEARAAGHTDLQSVAVLVTLPVLAVLVALGRRRPSSSAPEGE